MCLLFASFSLVPHVARKILSEEVSASGPLIRIIPIAETQSPEATAAIVSDKKTPPDKNSNCFQVSSALAFGVVFIDLFRQSVHPVHTSGAPVSMPALSIEKHRLLTALRVWWCSYKKYI